MARNAWKTPVNSESTREHLERCLIEAEHSSDVNVQNAAAQARAELSRREQQEREERFNAESAERVKAQQFQEGQNTRLIEAQKKLMQQQLDIAKGAATAAKWSAVAAMAIVALTAILAFVAARPLFAPEPSDMPAATAPPSATKSE